MADRDRRKTEELSLDEALTHLDSLVKKEDRTTAEHEESKALYAHVLMLFELKKGGEG